MLPRELGSSPHDLLAENCRLDAAIEVTPEPGHVCPMCDKATPWKVNEESREKSAAYAVRELGS